MNRAVKYLTAGSKPAFWAALAKGVMPAVEHIQAIKTLHPKTLIDVGANKGQFSLIARYLFPDIEIHAFEPLEKERSLFSSVVHGNTKLYPVALAAETSTREFFVASRRDSSSLLRIGTAQKMAYGVEHDSTQTVSVVRFSDILNGTDLSRPVLMKIDVQGGELSVLLGAAELLRHVDFIYCEASFVPLYDEQPLASQIVAYLLEKRFCLGGVFNQSVTREFGPTQADFLFQTCTPG